VTPGNEKMNFEFRISNFELRMKNVQAQFSILHSKFEIRFSGGPDKLFFPVEREYPRPPATAGPATC